MFEISWGRTVVSTFGLASIFFFGFLGADFEDSEELEDFDFDFEDLEVFDFDFFLLYFLGNSSFLLALQEAFIIGMNFFIFT